MGRRTRLAAAETPANCGEITVSTPDPLMWSMAMKEAKGDVRRIRRMPDGSVVVLRSA